MRPIARHIARASTLLLLTALGTGLLAAAPDEAPSGPAILLAIDGPIGPATSDYIRRGLDEAGHAGAPVVLLRINTPGGLDAATRDINQAILASPVAVVAYVAPSGARAASAGTYIVYASHIAAMAPATSLGAATPVGLGGGDIGGAPERPERDAGHEKSDQPEAGNTRDDKTKKQAETSKPSGSAQEAPEAKPQEPTTALGRKSVNDAASYMRTLAELRGRNAEFAEAAVRSAATLTAREALTRGVIDLIADDVDHLLAQLDGREVVMGETRLALHTKGIAVRAIEPDWRNRLLAVLTDPTIAYLLLLAGLYGLVLEGYHPGAILPGTVGAIALLLALYALHVLPVNYAGLALIVLGVGLIVTETVVPGYGALGIGGVAALVLGSILLLDVDVPGYGVSRGLIFGIAASTGIAMVLILRMATRARSRPVSTGVGELLGHRAIACGGFQERGSVRIRGEIWQATSAAPVQSGQALIVESIEGLTLKVKPE